MKYSIRLRQCKPVSHKQPEIDDYFFSRKYETSAVASYFCKEIDNLDSEQTGLRGNVGRRTERSILEVFRGGMLGGCGVPNIRERFLQNPMSGEIAVHQDMTLYDTC